MRVITRRECGGQGCGRRAAVHGWSPARHGRSVAGRPGGAQGGRCPGRTARCDKSDQRSAQSKRGRAPQPRSNRCLPPITGYHATLMATASPHPAPPRRATSHSQHFQGHTTWLPLQTTASLLTASNWGLHRHPPPKYLDSAGYAQSPSDLHHI